MLVLATTIFLFALILLWRARQRQLKIGLPAGRVIYADTRSWGQVETPLYDPRLALSGRPDYLVETADHISPVELKSSRVSAAPYDAHIFQLATYCLLVQRHFGKRPPYGILHYPNRTFAIDYTVELEAALLGLLEEMRSKDRRKEIQRSHDSPSRCSRCGFGAICDRKLM